MSRFFYGWRIVAVCLVAAVFANALGLFGAGVYLHVLVESKGWSTGAVSSSIALFYISSALLLVPVGGIIGRAGPQPVFAVGAAALAAGVAAVGQVTQPWQTYVVFVVMGIGWACLSMTAVATTLAPWFERHQGRAVSIASLGASVGGMVGAPILIAGIAWLGLPATTGISAATTLAVVPPLALLVMKRRPQDLGLLPDGAVDVHSVTSSTTQSWSRRSALRTVALRSVMLGFAIGMMMQIGFVTHQVTLLSPSLGAGGTSLTVSATAIAALLGRLVLARFADQMSARLTASVMMTLAAAALAMQALFPVPAVLILGSVLMGLTIGNVTTLAPIIVRREFGPESFGALYGVASCVIQLGMGLGPGFYGLLHDASGSYRVPFLLAAAADLVAALVVSAGAARAVSLQPRR
ncbi:MFS transporter [Reyranella soli]|uniref:MFS transporter n=1 Tax=Reyranella soli TaxID=1230389 RepID=A0A512N9U1_9HYPH|nr:MFS transporter [Reyranella soli]GEP55749.1 MFS transporter [Reyranella soli]